jgi:hypothetical protein
VPLPEEGDANLTVRWQVMRGELKSLGGSEALFWHLYGDKGAEDTFWLDRWEMLANLIARSSHHKFVCTWVGMFGRGEGGGIPWWG